ncbi:hypothetical protein BBJ28_00003899 [Nothophytophthora sp. Chile5]|nr:hypothetical protein BBJ28_00003899 [Nothophytophthora sp. Chile5]
MPDLTAEALEMPLTSSYRVAVIGAGLAGVSATNALLASGQFGTSDVCLLEAQSRIGGRVHTQSFSDTLPVNVEVGAAWIHGTEGNPFAKLAQKFGIAFKEISPRNPWLHPGSCSDFLLFEGSRQLSDQQAAETWEWQDLLMRKLQALARAADRDGHGDKSVAAVVDDLVASDPQLVEVMAGVNARERLNLFLRLIEAWMGLTADDLNLDAFVETDLMGDDPGAHCIVPAGMERFIDHLSEPLKDVIHTNVSVSAINYDGPDGVVIECTDGRTVTADHVIVATSLGFLQTGRLHFQPELPSVKTGAIKRSKMGQYMKVLVQFPEVFWPKQATFMAQIQDNSNASDCNGRRIYFPLVFNYYLAKNVPILEGVLIGDKASEISASFTDEEIAHALFLQMQDTFGPDIPEPWSVGAYSCVTVQNAYEDPNVLKQTVANRVLFAGEAANLKYQGALQAAYFSGALRGLIPPRGGAGCRYIRWRPFKADVCAEGDITWRWCCLQYPRVLCFVITYSLHHGTKARAVDDTWGQRCDKLIFFSNMTDSIVVGAGTPAEQTNDKNKAALRYVHANFRNDYDWFYKADDDSYVVMENLRNYLKRPEIAHTYNREPMQMGHRLNLGESAVNFYIKNETLKTLWHSRWDRWVYHSGGPGYVMNRLDMNKIVEILDDWMCLSDPDSETIPDDAGISFCMMWHGVDPHIHVITAAESFGTVSYFYPTHLLESLLHASSPSNIFSPPAVDDPNNWYVKYRRHIGGVHLQLESAAPGSVAFHNISSAHSTFAEPETTCSIQQ